MKDTLPEPWENVDGTDRTGFLLSLDDDAAEHRQALMRMAGHLQAACLVGNPAPVVSAMWERVSNPVPGDLVAETTRAIRLLDYQGLGILLAHRTEQGCPETDAWYIQYGNGHRDIARWENCQFITLPVTASQTREAAP